MTRGGVPGSIPGIPQQEKVAEVRPLKVAHVAPLFCAYSPRAMEALTVLSKPDRSSG